VEIDKLISGALLEYLRAEKRGKERVKKIKGKKNRKKN